MPVTIIVGLPEALRPRIEGHFRGRVSIRSLLIKRDGGFQLVLNSYLAANQIRDAAERANGEVVFALVLPYVRIAQEIEAALAQIVSIGAAVSRPSANVDNWPAKPPRFDGKFLDELFVAICSVIENYNPEPQDEAIAEHRAIICDLLRGLATHSKMGPNNHSHEDDMWKARGGQLGPGGREEVVKGLLLAGILGRKRNNSMGGTGWVYWIADVAIVRTQYPEISDYLK